MTVAASFSGSGANLSGPTTLSMQIHGLRFDGQASVQVNNSNWMSIANATVTFVGLAGSYGGIGGGFSTLQMNMSLPSGTVTTGTNTITFRFNGTDGRVSGFRVLGFNILDTSGNQVIPSSNFVWDDPTTWQPPSSASSDIAAGQSLYQTAALTVPTASGTQSILAHCMDCHTQDGRDLKYFNYSNNSIEARSIFHGLTAQQGSQIASYIRTLNVPNPGRPWNPPYQPGPGLDSQPVQDWAAGAGISSLLSSDADLLNELVPGGVPGSLFSPTSVLNARQTSLPFELPDWNSWLPMIHPKDAWPDFATSQFAADYNTLRGMLQPGSATAYANAAGMFNQWTGDYGTFETPKTTSAGLNWTPTYIQQVFSIPLWAMVKSWELNQEFGLEGMAQTVFTNPKAEPRAWLSEFPFLTSPNMLQIPKGVPGLGNGQLNSWEAIAFIWYQLQLVLNDSEYQEVGNSPIDFGYIYGFVSSLSTNDSPPQAGLLNLWTAKGIQIENNGSNPSTTWNYLVPDISRQVSPTLRSAWIGTPASTRTAISNAVVQAWLQEVQQFTPQQFYNYWYAPISAAEVPVPDLPDSPNYEDRIWYMIPQFRYFGVSQNLINQMVSFAQSIWPNGNWSALATATCVPDSSDPTLIHGSTD